MTKALFTPGTWSLSWRSSWSTSRTTHLARGVYLVLRQQQRMTVGVQKKDEKRTRASVLYRKKYENAAKHLLQTAGDELKIVNDRSCWALYIPPSSQSWKSPNSNRQTTSACVKCRTIIHLSGFSNDLTTRRKTNAMSWLDCAHSEKWPNCSGELKCCSLINMGVS